MFNFFSCVLARIGLLAIVLFLSACGQSEPPKPEKVVPSAKNNDSPVIPKQTVSFDSPQDYIAKSQKLLKLGQFEKAHAEINKSIVSPTIKIDDMANALSIRALIYFQRKNIAQAVADLNLAILLSKGKYRNHFQGMRGAFLGAAYFTEENVFLLILFLADHRRSPGANRPAANALVSIAKKLLVKDLYDAFTPLDQQELPKILQKKTNPEMSKQVQAGFQNLLDEKYTAAAEEMTKVLDANPKNTMALVGRAVALSCASSDLKRVQTDLEKALKINSNLVVAEELLMYHQMALPNKSLALPPSREERITATATLAREHGFSSKVAEKVAVEVHFIRNEWGKASKEQRMGHVFAGLAHADLSPGGKMLMPFLIEISETEERMRVRQRWELVISQLEEIGMIDPRNRSKYKNVSTAELLEKTKSMRWDKSPLELQAIGRALRNRSQKEVDQVVAAWSENARLMNPSFSGGPTLRRHLTLQRVIQELGPTSVPALIRMLKNPEIAHIRESVVAILAIRQDRRCIEPLKTVMQDGLGKEAFRRRARNLLESWMEKVPERPVDPLVINTIKTIKNIVVSAPYKENYLDFRRYELGLIEAGVIVVKPLTKEILSMRVPEKEVGVRLHDIGGTPARVLLGIALEKDNRKKVENSIGSFFTAIVSENDTVALETKWYIICVLSEMTDTLQKREYRSHSLRSYLNRKSAVLMQSVKHLGPVTANSLAVEQRLKNMYKEWQVWKDASEPLK